MEKYKLNRIGRSHIMIPGIKILKGEYETVFLISPFFQRTMKSRSLGLSLGGVLLIPGREVYK